MQILLLVLVGLVGSLVLLVAFLEALLVMVAAVDMLHQGGLLLRESPRLTKAVLSVMFHRLLLVAHILLDIQRQLIYPKAK